MLIIFDDSASDFEDVHGIYVCGVSVNINYATDQFMTRHFNTEAEARKAYNRIVDALIDDARVCDLRGLATC